MLESAGAHGQTLTFDLGGGSLSRTMVQLFALTTVLSLAPTIAVTITSFTRLVVVLSLLRSAIGLQQSPPNIVLTSLALFLTFFIMGPTVDKALTEGITPYMSESISEEQAFDLTVAPFKTFMLRNVRASAAASTARWSLFRGVISPRSPTHSALGAPRCEKHPAAPSASSMGASAAATASKSAANASACWLEISPRNFMVR